MSVTLKIGQKIADGLYAVSGQMRPRAEMSKTHDVELLIKRDGDKARLFVDNNLHKCTLDGRTLISVAGMNLTFEPESFRRGTEIKIFDKIQWNFATAQKPSKSGIIHKKQKIDN